MEDALRMAGWLAVGLYAALMLYTAISDLLTYEIPNWTSVAVALSFLPAGWAAGWSLSAIGLQLSAGGGVLVIGFLMYLKGLAGGGDIKLMAAAAVWAGWPALLELLILIALAGGLLALAILVFRRVTLPARLCAIGWLAQLHEKQRGIPYGVAISLAALYALHLLPVVRDLAGR